MKSLLALVLVLICTGRSSASEPVDVDSPFNVRLKIEYRGLGVGGSEVELVIDGVSCVQTHADSDGWVEFLGLSSERFEVVARKPGYFPRRVIYYNFSRRDILDDFPLKKRIRWTLSGTVRGRDQMIGQAKVTLRAGADSQEEATTDPSGRFSFAEMYDTECRFSVDAFGFRRRTVWAANRNQVDLQMDVELTPKTASASQPYVWGEQEESISAKVVGWDRMKSWPAERGLVLLSYWERIEPGATRPRDAVELVRLLCPFGGRPGGSLSRTDHLLTGWVMQYHKSRRSPPSVPFDAGKLRRDRR